MKQQEFGQGDFADYLSKTSMFDRKKSEQASEAREHRSHPIGRSVLGWEGRIGLSVIGVLAMLFVGLVSFRIAEALRPVKPKMTHPKVARGSSMSQLVLKTPALPPPSVSQQHNDSASPRAFSAAIEATQYESPLRGASAPRAAAAVDDSFAPPDRGGGSRYSQNLKPPPAPLPPPSFPAETGAHKPNEAAAVVTAFAASSAAEQTQTGPNHRPQNKAPQLAPGAAYAARMYLVQTGDTLPSIANRELGERRRWVEIWQLNRTRLKGELSRLQPGIKLIMPENITTTARSPRVRSSPESGLRMWR